ncbi:DNA-binding response regulator [Thalassotalea insulae]|uniref:DNA-binding response regulator n=1 Tax=Thalassotalea insulae TaxID=2056778 RepID=A0ABQ6GMF1_9GAMM|nr:response regulator [Thalassotalea insulae]GLX77097.1 DNA-binding response regulator [Thalassotalea insulae]
MRVLLVEDDIALAQGLQQSLRREGYSIDCVHDGKSALLAISAGSVEMVILDLGLPDMDGLQVLKQAKAKYKQLPILILTARDSSDDKVEGLDYGADDYLVKPFDMAELFARLRVIERRLGTADSARITHNNVILDTKANQVFLDGEAVSFSRREYMIVKSLMENIGRIQSKEQLENKLYEWGEEVASNTIEVHVHHVRKKLPKDFIKTVRGVGYIVSKR